MSGQKIITGLNEAIAMTDISKEAVAAPISDQRMKYEQLCARIAVGKASQQDAIDAIQNLCADNERLAVIAGKRRAALDEAEATLKTVLDRESAAYARHDAAIAKAEAERDALTQERPFIVGANHGYEVAMGQAAEEARRIAAMYPQSSDGRNTFTLFAEWADSAAHLGAKP